MTYDLEFRRTAQTTTLRLFAVQFSSVTPVYRPHRLAWSSCEDPHEDVRVGVDVGVVECGLEVSP